MDFLYRYETLGTGAGRVKMDEEAGYSLRGRNQELPW